MKRYKVLLHPKVFKALTKKFDPYQARLISGWLRKNIDGCINPYIHGKHLKANLKELWRYRIGNYRAISLIRNGIAIVLILKITHRREVYHGVDLRQIKLRVDNFLSHHNNIT